MNADNSQDTSEEYEIDIRRIVKDIINKWKIIAVIVVAVSFLTLAYSAFIMTPSYETEFDIFISFPETATTQFGEYTLPVRTNAEYIELITSNEVLANTIKDVDFGKKVVLIENFRESISVDYGTISPVENQASSYHITVSANTAEKSLLIAQKLFENYTEYVSVVMDDIAVKYYVSLYDENTKALENSIEVTNEILIESEALLAITPETINQREAMDAIVKGGSDYIILENIINPNYTSLQKEIIDRKQSIITSTAAINRNVKYLEKLETEQELINKYSDPANTEFIEVKLLRITEHSIYLASQPVLTNTKVSPSVIANTVKAGAFAFVLCVLGVLGVMYWKKEI